MYKYIVFVGSVIKGDNFIKRENLKSTHKLFNSPEEAIAAVQAEIERTYCNSKCLIVSEMELPIIEKYCREKTGALVYGGGFTCRFKPYKKIPVFFRVYINTIHID